MTDSFTSELWQSVAGIYEAILAHPFLAGLADGSLPEETFAFYVVQDGLYLKQYGHTLAAIASRALDASDTEMFARHFIGVVAVEQQLHDSLLADLGIDPAIVQGAEMAPTTLAFTSYLLATARGGSYAEGVGAAAVLLDLLGGRQGTTAPGVAGPALPAVDRHLQRRGLRRVRPGGAGPRQPAKYGPVRRRAREPALVLPGQQPLRVDVLGHGLPDGNLADLGLIGPGAGRLSAGRQRTEEASGTVPADGSPICGFPAPIMVRSAPVRYGCDWCVPGTLGAATRTSLPAPLTFPPCR